VRLAGSDLSVSTARTVHASATRDTPPPHKCPPCAVRKAVVQIGPTEARLSRDGRTNMGLLSQYESAE